MDAVGTSAGGRNRAFGGLSTGGLALPAGPRLDRARYQWQSFILLGPALLLLLGLFVIPSFYAFYLGFTNLSLLGPTAVHYGFTGTANLERLIHDPGFFGSLKTTAIFALGSVIGAVVAGMLLALALRAGSRALGVVAGGVVVVCWMLPAVSAGFAWYATTTAGGTLASLLGTHGTDFLGSQPLAVVTVANIWSQTGFVMVVFAAGLRNIPHEILEAARVERASEWQCFWRITLPIMRPLVTTTVIIVLLLSLANFSLVYIMTQGGPGTATDILPIYSYQQGFTFDNLAYGALIGDALVLLVTVIAMVYVRASRTQI